MNKFLENRKQLVETLEDNNLVILHSGFEISKTADQFYKFVVNRNFYYMTGINQADVTVVFGKIDNKYCEWLFIDENDAVLIKWVGEKLYPAQASEVSGVELKNIKFNPEYTTFIHNLFQPSRISPSVIEKISLDLESKNVPMYSSFALNYAKSIKENYPAVCIKNIYPEIIKYFDNGQKR